MSRFLPDPPLLVEISRGSVRVSAPGGAPLSSPLPPLAGDEFSWDTALAAVEQLVRKQRSKRAALSVVLGDAWMRYFVIDWPRQYLTALEQQAFAAQAFARLYEQPAAGWLLTAASTGVPGKRLLCGMQRSAVAALDAMLQRCNWQIENLTGAFAAGFDLAAPALAGITGYFVYSHDSIAHCARLEAGALTMVRGQAMADGSAMARAGLGRRCAAVVSPALAGGGFHALLVDCDPGDFPAVAGRNLRRALLAGRTRRGRFLTQIGKQWLAA